MKRTRQVRRVVQAGVALLLACLAVGCRRDMFSQPKYNPLEPSALFKDGASARPLVAHTVARGHLDENEPFFTGFAHGKLIEAFPVRITRSALERGRERFEIYCAVCHGRVGDGHGPIVQRGFPAPPSFHIERLRTAPPGHFFDVITRGYGVMFSYATRVEPADRWAIVAYIRALQLSQGAPAKELPAAEREKLGALP